MVTQIREADSEFKTSVATYASAAVSSYQVAQLEFWKYGLDLIETTNSEKCPFCEEQTITQDKIQELRTRLGAEQNLTESRELFLSKTNQYIDILAQFESNLSLLEFKPIPDEAVVTLEKLFESDKKRLQAFCAENKQTVLFVLKLREVITQAKTSLSNLKTSITKPNEVTEAVTEVAEIPVHIERAWGEAAENLKQYNETYVAFRPIFEQELSDEATVTKFTNLIDILNEYHNTQIVAEAKSFDSEILEAQRLVEEYILNQQKAALASREKDILDWYSLLSPNTDVKFSGLTPGRNAFSLKAEAFGKTMNAAASLSQSQLNCLGLSIYIPSVSAHGSPFKFILFDDPVQAMDDEHHESFLVKVVPELKDTHGFQVIVLTHLKETADRLRDINFTSNFVYYRFDKLQSTGPVSSPFSRNMTGGNGQGWRP